MSNYIENKLISGSRTASKLKIIQCDDNKERLAIIDILNLNTTYIYAGSFVAWLAGYISTMNNNINVYKPIVVKSLNNNNGSHCHENYPSSIDSNDSEEDDDDDDDSDNNDCYSKLLEEGPSKKRIKINNEKQQSDIFARQIQKYGVFSKVQIEYFVYGDYDNTIFVENLLSTFDQNICKFALYYCSGGWCFAHLMHDTVLLKNCSLERLHMYNTRYKASDMRNEYTNLLQELDKLERRKTEVGNKVKQIDNCIYNIKKIFKNKYCDISEVIDDEFEFDKLKPICNFYSIVTTLILTE